MRMKTNITFNVQCATTTIVNPFGFMNIERIRATKRDQSLQIYFVYAVRVYKCSFRYVRS